MGKVSDWSKLGERASGKWQLPLLAVALAVLGLSVYRIRPTPRSIPFDDALKYLDTLVAGGFFDQAVAAARTVHERSDLTDARRAAVNVRLARASHGLLQPNSRDSADNAERIVESYRAAQSAGGSRLFEPDDFTRLGEALEWQGQYRSALEAYGRAVEGGVDNAIEIRKRIYELERDRSNAASGTPDRMLGEIMAEAAGAPRTSRDATPGERLDLLTWALEEKLRLADAKEDVEAWSDLFASYEGALAPSEFRDRGEFLKCEARFKSGDADGAEVCLRTLRNQVDPLEEASARAGWLLGVVITRGTGVGRALEGLSFFDDVLRWHIGGPYATASRVGRGEALALLGRHEEALEAYRWAVGDLGSLADTRVVSVASVRASLAVTAELERQAGRLESAVGYAELAAQLVDSGDVESATAHYQRLAQLLAMLGDRTESELAGSSDSETALATGKRLEVAREYYRRAAEWFEQLALINVFDGRLEVDFSWQAAESWAKAGATRKATERYRAFTKQQSDDGLVPRALFRIGQLHQEAGEFRSAVSAFQECYRRFPHSLDGARALAPLARCYMAMGPEKLESAQAALEIVLEGSDMFTPEAPEFADALFLIGEVYERRGEYEASIARLREAVARYGDDPRVWRARFLTADAYRRSASALRKEAGDATLEAEAERIRAESAGRFGEARELYRALIRELESRSAAGLEPLEQTYLQHAYLYEADCYFETQEYARALELYERAAGNLRGSVRGLAAYVQIMNCHVFMGKPKEARATLARAMVIVDAMPNGAFDGRASPQSREEWKKYLAWLGESDLF